MVTVSTPVDLEGRHVATVSHDVLLEELVHRTLGLGGNQAQLGPFFTEDQRGRSFVPYLNRLGQNLLEEREGIRSLLDDVERWWRTPCASTMLR